MYQINNKFTKMSSGVGTLAKCFHSDLLIVDVGMKHRPADRFYTDKPFVSLHKIVNRRIAPGTKNLAEGRAMSPEEVLRALEIGLEMADSCQDAGYDVLGVGEMGIGNTTTSSSVLSSLMGLDSSATVGRGAGLQDGAFQKKCLIVDQASAELREKSEIGRGDVIEILSSCGGFDLCAMAGFYIGAARHRIPVVIDGFISAVAALVAFRLAPKTVNYMFASHFSQEKGYSLAIDELGLVPFLNLKMRLGEGSGCPIAFQIIQGACRIVKEMSTFDDAGIDDDYIGDIAEEECFRQ